MDSSLLNVIRVLVVLTRSWKMKETRYCLICFIDELFYLFNLIFFTNIKLLINYALSII